MSQRVLDRLSFGAKRAELDYVDKVGLRHWMAEQLTPTAEDPAVDEALKTAVLRINYGATPDFAAVNENRPLSLLDKTTPELWHLTDGQNKIHYEERIRPLRELTAARLLRAAHSRWQVKELMVDFWLDHFNVHAGDQSIAVAMPSFERDCIRKHGLGNFADLLHGVAKSTPMLIYLNNRSSRTGAPNENYARELFELHTLGKGRYLNDLYNKWRQVPGADKGQPEGYIDQDVYEAARAFTGWVVEDGRGIGNGAHLPKTGKFAYLDTWHDPYQKRVLAKEIDPFAPPMKDGEAVLNMLADHHGTAQHICEKLCRRFVSDAPPAALVASSAKVWGQHKRHPQQIARVLEHIFTSSAFTQATQAGGPQKLKRPLELAMSFVRKLDLPHAPSIQLANELSAAGQRLYLWPTPDGHPDVTDYWLTTQSMRRRWTLPMGLMDNWWATGHITPEHLAKGFAKPVEETALIAHHAHMLLGKEHAPQALAQIASAQKTPAKRVLGVANDEWATVRRTLAYLAMSPAFQWK